MFSMKDLIGEALKNYPGGSASFDEAADSRPGPHMEQEPDADDAEMPLPGLPPAEPRPIMRSPFGQSMGRERRMR